MKRTAATTECIMINNNENVTGCWIRKVLVYQALTHITTTTTTNITSTLSWLLLNCVNQPLLTVKATDSHLGLNPIVTYISGIRKGKYWPLLQS